MDFKQCCVCNLSLPINMMRPIQVKNKGKIITVGICDRCYELKKQEAQRRPNETN